MGQKKESEKSLPSQNPVAAKETALVDQTDKWLLQAWKTGDQRAADILFDRYAFRLVALVASRLNRKYQSSIDPDEIVQSALGSFFNAAKHSRIEVSNSLSLWRLLATFARRKMSRSIERVSASKRGGQMTRVAIDEAELEADYQNDPSEIDAAEFLSEMKAELPDDCFTVVEGLLSGMTQRELAESLGIDERTVRRRLSRVREIFDTKQASDIRQVDESNQTILPKVSYREFVLGKLIGAGGFGKVYRASMQSDGRVVAVKFLRKSFWKSEDARQTFLREINVASRIRHPGVASYLGYGESPQGGPYVISQWIEGSSLQQIRASTTTQFSQWLKQICEAMEAVHQSGLVHGDLTPSNVLVDRNDRITITDFGFSRVLMDLASTERNATIDLGGTLGFAAPEQIDSAFGLISEKTDLYAIGGLVHWHFYRRPPNFGDNVHDTLYRTLSPNPKGPSSTEPIPQLFREMMDRTLCKSPADRSISLFEIIQLLGSS